MRDPRYRAAQYADCDQLAWPMYTSQNVVYTSPWGHHPMAPSPTWQHPTQLSPGIHWGPHQWDYARAARQGGSPRPQPLAWEHAYSSNRATTAGLPTVGNPTTVRNPLAYDSSAAERGPSEQGSEQGSEQPQQETQDQPPPGLVSLILFLRVRGHGVTRYSPSRGVRQFPQRRLDNASTGPLRLPHGQRRIVHSLHGTFDFG